MPVVLCHPMLTITEQVAKDGELLKTARDCFYFVTTFFEPISASAMHIYHSALELCPLSSIVRKLYYRSPHHITSSPRVIAGSPDSWDQTISISSKDYDNGLCAWSPCGRFVAVRTQSAIEIRNQLTLELLTVLQPTESSPLLTGSLAYSPDGRSIACASGVGVLIWDIQTGGVARGIEGKVGSTSPVWLSDGRICTIRRKDGAWGVYMHDFSSGLRPLFVGRLRPQVDVDSWVEKQSLWVYKKSLFVTAAHRDLRELHIDVLEVGCALTKLHSFHVALSPEFSCGISFSPATRHVSISTGASLRIVNSWNSDCLLEETGDFRSASFSPDGCLFAASKEGGVFVWKHMSNRYILWKDFRCRGSAHFLQFSPIPTSTSLLARHGNALQVWRLQDPPTAPQTRRELYTALSRTGSHIAMAYQSERVVTITDLRSPKISQSVDTGLEVEGLTITGNVLLVVGSREAVAWLFTEEGLVCRLDSVVVAGRANRGNSIWNTPLPQFVDCGLSFLVGDQVCAFERPGGLMFLYDSETGEVVRTPSKRAISLRPRAFGRPNYLHGEYLSLFDSWQQSRLSSPEGWIKDRHGKHRLWIPVGWRESWRVERLRRDSRTVFASVDDSRVIIVF